MSPRTGRPKKADARRICLNLRLTAQEDIALREISVRLGVSRTEVLMRGLRELEKMEVDAKEAVK